MARMLALLIILLSFTSNCYAQSTLVIDDIVMGDRITGMIKASGIDAAQSCVVVYIRTNHWYIHPYAAAGEDQSWASINGNAWSIPTLRRGVAANAVAALLLRKDKTGGCAAPAEIEDVALVDRRVGVPFLKQLRPGDAWYGRL